MGSSRHSFFLGEMMRLSKFPYSITFPLCFDHATCYRAGMLSRLRAELAAFSRVKDKTKP
jgi:hypothetical protein